VAFGRTKPVNSRSYDENGAVPPALRIAGAYSWRILAIVAVIAVVFWVIAQLRDIVVPFFVAILVAALLVPLVKFLVSKGWPKALAVALAMVGTIAVVAGLIVIVVLQIRSGYPDLQIRSVSAFTAFTDFLANSALQIDSQQLQGYLDQALAALQRDSQALVSGALSIGTTAGHVIAGLFLTVFATLFILIDGRGIWTWVVGLFPRASRAALDGSGRAGWVTLTTFVRIQIFVAAVDAIGIGLGAWILGLVFGGFPLVIPIAIAVFLGSFIPVVGAVITGTLAVFVALVYLGPLPALIMVGIVLAVQQIEGHVLQPFIMGTAVRVHPVAVVFGVAAGSFIAGIPGALFAVPVIAVLNVMVKYIASGGWRTAGSPEAKDVTPHA
jgi:predicted PurR-regulated permease PerM